MRIFEDAYTDSGPPDKMTPFGANFSMVSILTSVNYVKKIKRIVVIQNKKITILEYLIYVHKISLQI